MKFRFTVTTSQGLEDVLAQELRKLGLQRVAPERGAVRFFGKLKDGYKAALWCRIGSRVLLTLKRFEGLDEDDLYTGIQEIDWLEHIAPEGSLWVDFVGGSKHLRHSQFGARRTKDAIVDQIRDKTNKRPSVEKHNPDLRINVHLRDGLFSVAIDLSGKALHWRTPGKESTEATIKETLAAALLHLADWPAQHKKGIPLVDPMCGSGTILSEAAGIARSVAPGLHRSHWGFDNWKGHDIATWNRLKQEAYDLKNANKDTPLHILGFDASRHAVRSAQANLNGLGFRDLPVKQQPFGQFTPTQNEGILLFNPPYGERLEAEENLNPLYRSIGDRLKETCDGWTCYILAPRPLLRNVGLKPFTEHPVHNGPLHCRLSGYRVYAKREHP